MDSYTIHMVLRTFVVAHISQLHTAMVAPMQDLFSEFHDVLVTHTEFYSPCLLLHHGMNSDRISWFHSYKGPWGWWGEIYLSGEWDIVTRELLVREELK